MSGEDVRITHLCKHCGDPVGQGNGGHWFHIHEHGDGERRTRTALYRCQHTVPYGQDAEPGEAIDHPATPPPTTHKEAGHEHRA